MKVNTFFSEWISMANLYFKAWHNALLTKHFTTEAFATPKTIRG
ncbi:MULTISPECIES: hypothetical protein [unclassified Pseudoalteromonas]|nr:MULTISPECIES: hypothetical protein [unclassified Pseudoalteromonas]